MTYTLKRATRAMLVTSVTTAAAFMATGFSDLNPISTFGIFSAIIIPINFIFDISAYPAFIVIYENKIKNKCSLRKMGDTESTVEAKQAVESPDVQPPKTSTRAKHFTFQ